MPKIDEKEVVTNVVSALQPSIAEAVAKALASLQSSTVSYALPLSSSESIKEIVTSANIADTISEEPANAVDTTKPVYSYEYTVAGNDTNTYITKSERREGDLVTGTYSYLDPEGALVTVTYEAGPDGYSQTLEKQEGFTLYKKESSNDYTPSSLEDRVTNTRPSTTPRPRLPSYTPSSTPSSLDHRATNSNLRSTDTRLPTFSATSNLDQSALIAQIISALQPTISSAVQKAITPDIIGKVPTTLKGTSARPK